MLQKNSLTERVLISFFGLILFITPLFYLPFTLDVINLSKQFLLYVSAGILFFIWLITLFINKKIVIYKTIFDIPIILMWLVFLFSTIFSQSRQESFFGEASIFSYSLLFHTALVIFYFTFVQITSPDTKKIKTLFCVLNASLGLAALYFIIAKWFGGISIIDSYIGINITSSLNTIFGILLILPLITSFAELMNQKNSIAQKVFHFIVALVTLIAIFGIGFKTLMYPLAIASALLLVAVIYYSNTIKYFWSTVVFGVLLLSILFMFTSVPAFARFTLPVELSLSNKLSYQITKSALEENVKSVILGQGPGSFPRLFSLYKAAEFNAVNPYWSLRFSQPRSSVIAILAETGIISTLTLLLMVAAGVFIGIKNLLVHKKSILNHENESDQVFAASLFAVFVAMSVTLFTSNFQAVIWLVWWLLLASVAIFYQPKEKTLTSVHNIDLGESPQHNLALSFITVLVFIVFIAFGTYLGRLYMAEVNYTKAIRTDINKFEDKINAISKSISLRPAYANYRLIAAQIALDEAKKLSQAKNQETEKISQLYNYSLSQARTASSLNPNSVSTWQVLAIMYGQALKAAPKEASALAVDALQRAIALEPINPVFYNQLANVYAFQNNTEKAQESYRKAIELKPDLDLSYLNFSLYYLSINKLNEAITVLEDGAKSGAANINYIISMAELYNKRGAGGDKEKAVGVLNKIIGADNKNIRAMMLLADIYSTQGNKDEASRLYRAILNVDPENNNAKSKLINISNATTPEPVSTTDLKIDDKALPKTGAR